MSEKSSIYYLSSNDLDNIEVLHNYIYKNMESNYYISDDFSKDFYVKLAFCGFISISYTINEKLYLLPEIQFEYAILDFENLHISKKVKKLLNQNNYQFKITKNLNNIIEKLESYHKSNWLKDEYKELLNSLIDYSNPKIDFEIFSIELYDKNTKELIAGEIGYKIASTYTSLTGFSSKKDKYKNWGKLQMTLLAKYLEKNNYSFWNLGHPYMQYKFDLGAKTYNRFDFLKRWLKEIK